jgi:hypothetical protein
MNTLNVICLAGGWLVGVAMCALTFALFYAFARKPHPPVDDVVGRDARVFNGRNS